MITLILKEKDSSRVIFKGNEQELIAKFEFSLAGLQGINDIIKFEEDGKTYFLKRTGNSYTVPANPNQKSDHEFTYKKI